VLLAGLSVSPVTREQFERLLKLAGWLRKLQPIL